MNGTASAAVSVLTRPFARIPEAQRQRICLILLTAAALAFPILHPNDADVDSMANAAAYATLALGLNIVVGFAGLLDLGYAAFFAIGAYTYGILTAFQLQPEWSALLGAVPLSGPGRADAGRDRRRQRGALHAVVLARTAAGGGAGGVLRHAVRRADAAAARRLPRDRHAGLRRDRADRGAQLVGPDQRRRRPERRRRAAAVRLELRRRCAALLLRRDRAWWRCWSSSASDCAIRASAAPGWRSARTRSPPARWASTAPSSSCWRSRSAPRSAA